MCSTQTQIHYSMMRSARLSYVNWRSSPRLIFLHSMVCSAQLPFVCVWACSTKLIHPERRAMHRNSFILRCVQCTDICASGLGCDSQLATFYRLHEPTQESPVRCTCSRSPETAQQAGQRREPNDDANSKHEDVRNPPNSCFRRRLSRMIAVRSGQKTKSTCVDAQQKSAMQSSPAERLKHGQQPLNRGSEANLNHANKSSTQNVSRCRFVLQCFRQAFDWNVDTAFCAIALKRSNPHKNTCCHKEPKNNAIRAIAIE